MRTYNALLWMTGAVLAALGQVADAQDYALLAGMESGPVVGVCTTQDGQKVKCIKFNPRETPPAATATPRPSPRPTPPRPPCPNGVERMFVEHLNPVHERFIDVGAGGVPAFAPGETRCFSFDLPNGVMPMQLVSLGTINRGNAQCSELVMDVQTPSGQILSSYGSQPGVTGFAQGNSGTWYIYARLTWGESPCNKFKIVALW